MISCTEPWQVIKAHLSSCLTSEECLRFLLLCPSSGSTSSDACRRDATHLAMNDSAGLRPCACNHRILLLHAGSTNML